MNCNEWLEELLQQADNMLYSTVKLKAREAGFTRGELKAARKALHVETVNDWAANGETLNWYWSLPKTEG